MSEILNTLTTLLPLLATIAGVILVLGGCQYFLKRRWENNPDAQFRFQLIMLSLSLASLLAVIISLPLDEALRGQLLSLIGILLSAAIALSATTFIGNIMAGVMLKVVGSARPGDFVTVGDLTGRISEMDLLHTEVQTELRDLVTVPNLFMVTNPLKVVRATGSIITAEVSLGYDVSHTDAIAVLTAAINDAGLKDGFVHVRELGDFSVLYRVAGLLEDIQSLISARSKLMVCVLDSLHKANIEIVSPNFMNTRAIAEGVQFIPQVSQVSSAPAQKIAEEVAFDKADEAASLEVVKKDLEQANIELKLLEKEKPADEAKLAELSARRDALAATFEKLSGKIKLEDTNA